MTDPAVFVTGASGTVGASVVEELLARGSRVVAAVRPGGDPGRLPQGAVPRQFEFGATPAGHAEALQGVDRLFLMRPPPIEDVRTYLFPLIDAAVAANLTRIVFLSLQGVQGNRKTPHHAVEQYLRQVGAPYTFLRPNFFMQNLSTTYRVGIRDHGEIFLPAGRSRTAFIDARDIGRVAAVVLTESGHTGKAYTLSGEQSISYRNVAEILSGVLRRPIRYNRPSESEYLTRLAADGQPPDYIDVQKMIYRIVRWNISAFPNRQVRMLTGRPATTFHQFATDYRAVWE